MKALPVLSRRDVAAELFVRGCVTHPPDTHVRVQELGRPQALRAHPGRRPTEIAPGGQWS